MTPLEEYDLIAELNKELDKLTAQRIVLIGYLQTKVEQRDWHGVADAAMDIREVEAKQTVLTNISEIICPI